ncbi:hypothetical protein [Chromobacterium alticapitis]|uniref:FAD-binding FR-type domain-containing protein n=1 Tax=Chromobacterium alticapitis TaxID=2073169 RepID=A0A2S5DFZ6_9NEIS|nr:hypothetical protein [Chromobacterium alticapitis]POZ61996.1 hypothetical protein C2I19_10610 [Chromobacterium alticapitis]
MRLRCRIEAGETLGGSTRRVWLHPLLAEGWHYAAGQYLKVDLPELGGAYFSIASAPGQAELELHVDARSAKALRLVELAERRETVDVVLPLGDCCLRESPAQPLLLVAGGSGFAQCQSLLLRLAELDCRQPLVLLWSADEAYLASRRPLLERLARRLDLSAQTLPREAGMDAEAWLAAGLRGARARHPSARIMVCGSKALLETVLRHVPEERVLSDMLPAVAERQAMV